MKNSIKHRIFVVFAMALTPMALTPFVAGGASIVIGIPPEKSNWQEKANIAAQGGFDWIVNSGTKNEKRPSGVTMFIRAGSQTGVVTNSDEAGLRNVNDYANDQTQQLGDGEWFGDIEAKLSPGVSLPYYFQALLMWKSFPYRDNNGTIILDCNQIGISPAS